jgi:hypothetical protein
MEPDRPHRDRPADCVIAQQYSSATSTSLCSHSRKGKFGAHFKSAISFFLTACLKLIKSGSVCSEPTLDILNEWENGKLKLTRLSQKNTLLKSLIIKIK